MVYFPTLTIQINHSCRGKYIVSYMDPLGMGVGCVLKMMPRNNTSNHTLCWQALDLKGIQQLIFRGPKLVGRNVRDKHIYLHEWLTLCPVNVGKYTIDIHRCCGILIPHSKSMICCEDSLHKSKSSWSLYHFQIYWRHLKAKYHCTKKLWNLRQFFHTKIHQFYEPKADPLFSSVSALVMTCPFGFNPQKRSI